MTTGRHVSRTRELLHCVSLESQNPIADYTVVRGELERFSPELAAKPEIVILTKSDTRESTAIKGIEREFESRGLASIVVSVLDDQSVKTLNDRIAALLSK